MANTPINTIREGQISLSIMSVMDLAGIIMWEPPREAIAPHLDGGIRLISTSKIPLEGTSPLPRYFLYDSDRPWKPWCFPKLPNKIRRHEWKIPQDDVIPTIGSIPSSVRTQEKSGSSCNRDILPEGVRHDCLIQEEGLRDQPLITSLSCLIMINIISISCCGWSHGCPDCQLGPATRSLMSFTTLG